MKIAIFFSGRINGFKDCYESFYNNILIPLSSHEVDGYAVLNADNSHGPIDDFIRDYKIKKWENCNTEINLYDFIPLDYHRAARKMSYKMYYYWYRAFQLIKESGIIYDLIIYLRADVIFHSPIVLPINPTDNILYIPEGNDWAGLNDQMAYGNFNVMKHYTNIYNNIPKIFIESRLRFHTETYVKLHNTVFEIKRVPIHYTLYRGWM